VPRPLERRSRRPFLLQIHRALERQRLQNEAEERAANERYERGDKGGYPWSRKEEMKARAISQGWQTVFAGAFLSAPALSPPRRPASTHLD